MRKVSPSISISPSSGEAVKEEVLPVVLAAVDVVGVGNRGGEEGGVCGGEEVGEVSSETTEVSGDRTTGDVDCGIGEEGVGFDILQAYCTDVGDVRDGEADDGDDGEEEEEEEEEVADDGDIESSADIRRGEPEVWR